MGTVFLALPAVLVVDAVISRPSVSGRCPGMSTTVQLVARETWSQLTCGFRDYNYRQVWEFGDACAARVNAGSEHVCVREGTELIGLADVRVKQIPLLGTGVAYVNGGPLVRHTAVDDPRRLRVSLAALCTEYVERRGLVLRIAPPFGPPVWNSTASAAFAALGFVDADPARRYRTLVVDLQRPLPDIRKTLAQKWRNCLNRAERNGLSIRTGTGDDLFAAFLKLYADLRERKNFGVDLDASFYARLQGELAPDEKFVVTIAEYQGQPVAGHVGSLLGDTGVYLLGASNRTGLEQKASYLLQWHALAAAQKRGCAWYDLGGIDPAGNRGVYHFKCGLGVSVR